MPTDGPPDFYDDAELTAIAIVRLLENETDDRGLSAEARELLHAYADRTKTSYGSDPVVVAMARQFGAALAALSKYRGVSVEELLDAFEMGKLQQLESGLEDE